MFRDGVWHQLGYNLHKAAKELVEHGIGEGCILSAGDAEFSQHSRNAKMLRSAGSQVVIDTQFHTPSVTNARITSYPFNEARLLVTEEHRAGLLQLDQIAAAIEAVNREINAAAVLAPALIYEAGRPEIADLNGKLFTAAKIAGDALGVPTFATVSLDRAVLAAESELDRSMSHASSLGADGFYLCVEFSDSKIASTLHELTAFGRACLHLALMEKPLLHGYAGPMSILSPGFGASSVGLCAYLSMWQFSRDRLEPSEGGGRKHPPRFFSKSLWSRVVIPDDLHFMGPELREQVLYHSPFSEILKEADLSAVKWPRGQTEKHQVYVIGETVSGLLKVEGVRNRAEAANRFLDNAKMGHEHLKAHGISLRSIDETNFHATWMKALDSLLKTRLDDYDLLELLADD